MVLFLVESPLQLLCAVEAKLFFNISNEFFIIRLSGNNSNDNQMIKLVNIFSLNGRVKYIIINSKNRNIQDYLKVIFYKITYYIKFKNYSKIFIGNFESSFFKLITKAVDKKRIILLDDGAKTLSIQNKFSNNYSMDFFSFFNLTPYSNQKIFHNDFSELRKKILNYQFEDKIILLGSKFAEVGLLTEEKYINCIENISNYFKNQGIIYVVHRGENLNKLEKLKKSLPNIIIEELDYPVELYGFNKLKIPKLVVSFHSTALFTMRVIYNCETISFKFNYKSSKHDKDINEVYDFYKKYMKVIEL